MFKVFPLNVRTVWVCLVEFLLQKSTVIWELFCSWKVIYKEEFIFKVPKNRIFPKKAASWSSGICETENILFHQEDEQCIRWQKDKDKNRSLLKCQISINICPCPALSHFIWRSAFHNN